MADQPKSTKPRNRRKGVNETELRSRENEAMRLHVAGMTLAKIGEHLGCHESSASRMVKRALDRATFAGATAMRQLQSQRLELVHVSAMQILGAKDATYDQKLKAMHQMVSVHNAKSRLYGLDAPERIQLDIELNHLLEVLRANVKEEDFERIAEQLVSAAGGSATREEPGSEAPTGSPLPN